MKRRFVVCIDNTTKEQQDIVTAWFKKSGVGYWHWLKDMWLVTDPLMKWNANKLRDELNSLLPSSYKMVIQIDGENTWSGYGNTNMFKWLKDTWIDKDDAS